jgi:hypothetical protein
MQPVKVSVYDTLREAQDRGFSSYHGLDEEESVPADASYEKSRFTYFP